MLLFMDLHYPLAYVVVALGGLHRLAQYAIVSNINAQVFCQHPLASTALLGGQILWTTSYYFPVITLPFNYCYYNSVPPLEC